MDKFAQLSESGIEKSAPEPAVEQVTIIPEWLRIKDDPDHPNDLDWFKLEADFSIGNMPDAVDHEIENKCGIEKLVVRYTHDFGRDNNGRSAGVDDNGQERFWLRKLHKFIVLHKTSMLSREAVVMRAVPILKMQRGYMLGLIPRPAEEKPKEPDTSSLYAAFY